MRFNPDEYVTVAERIEKFYTKHPDGKINTTIIEHDREAGFVLIRAEVYRQSGDTLPAATGHAYEYRSGNGPQATSYVEVCETSAVGRAIGNLGFEIKRGVASREEMQKAERQAPAQLKVAPEDESDEAHAAIDDQIIAMRKQVDKSDDDLTASARVKFKNPSLKDWDDLDMAGKRWLLDFLQKKAKAVA